MFSEISKSFRKVPDFRRQEKVVHLSWNFYGGDLANLLDLTGHATVKYMEFEVYVEVLRDNGRIEDQIIILRDIIMNSTSTELGNNSSLYEKPYYISSNKHNFAYKELQIRF